MPNLTILLAYEPESNLTKTLLDIAENMPTDWEVNLVSLYRHQLPPKEGKTYEYIYDSPIFLHKPTKDEENATETWVGFPIQRLLKGYYFYEHAFEKKSIYPGFVTQLVHFWREHFTKFKTNAFLSVLECDCPQTAAYEVARKVGVEALYPSVSRLGGGAIILDKNLHPVFYKELTGGEVLDGYQKTLSILKCGKPVKMGLIDKRNKFYRNRLQTTIPRLKYYFKRMEQYNKMTEFEQLSQPSTKTRTIRWLIRNARGATVPLMYRQPDLSAKFFLFPLSHQDEAYNSYYHGMLDQYDFIKVVSEALPQTHQLYVKPHPHFKGNDVQIGRILEIRKLKNVRVVPHDTSFKELLEHCTGVITIGATTGFEAIAYGKPVIVFGHPFYAKMKTVINGTDLQDLPYKIMRVIENPEYGVDEEQRKAYLGNYYMHQLFLKSKPIALDDLYFADETEAKMVTNAIAASYYQLKHKKDRFEPA